MDEYPYPWEYNRLKETRFLRILGTYVMPRITPLFPNMFPSYSIFNRYKSHFNSNLHCHVISEIQFLKLIPQFRRGLLYANIVDDLVVDGKTNGANIPIVCLSSFLALCHSFPSMVSTGPVTLDFQMVKLHVLSNGSTLNVQQYFLPYQTKNIL